MPKDIFVLVASAVQLNLVVLGVGKYDMKYAFGGPKGEIMSPRGEAKKQVSIKGWIIISLVGTLLTTLTRRCIGGREKGREGL